MNKKEKRDLKAPFFIIGNPRSGTTLLRLMLTCHQDLLVTPECGFAAWFYEKYKNKDPQDPATIHQYANDVAGAKKFDTWEIGKQELETSLLTTQPKNYSEMAAAVYHCYAKYIDKKYKRWGDKNNFHLNRIEQLLEIFPRAQFIHIVRDVRDVACSYKEINTKQMKSRHAPDLPSNIQAITEEWLHNIETIQESLYALPADMYMELRFQDLIKESSTILSAICEFLGVSYDSQMLSYHEENVKKKLEPEQMLEWKSKTLQPPMLSVIGRYKKDLHYDEILAVETIAKKQLDHYKFGR